MASYVPPKVTQALPPFHLDADNNAGIFHVEKERLTKEKADTVCEILKINHTAYHIFLLPEHDRGVCRTVEPIRGVFRLIVFARRISTTTSCTNSSLSGHLAVNGR